MYKKTPKLSVITPTLNASSTILETLRSVAYVREFCEIEHLVVDGGSDDGTLEIVSAFRPRPEQILISQEAGISSALNLGLESASGQLVGVLNADDLYLPETGQILQGLKVSFDTVLVGDVLLFQKSVRDGERRNANTSSLARYMSVFHSSMWVPLEVYRRYGGYLTEYEYAMDSELVHRWIAAGVTLQRVPLLISAMRLGGKSHRNMWRALTEFYRSVITHGLQSHPVANWYRFRQWFAQTLLRPPRVRNWYLAARKMIA